MCLEFLFPKLGLLLQHVAQHVARLFNGSASLQQLLCQTWDVAELIIHLLFLLPAARLSLLLFVFFSPCFSLSPCSFVADVIHWCGLLILQSGVRLAASLCSPSIAVLLFLAAAEAAPVLLRMAVTHAGDIRKLLMA